MPAQKFSDQLWSGLADAIADIREKVVEEPWFGRVLSERADSPEWPQAHQPQMERQGLDGDILSPERAVWPEPSQTPRLGHGSVLEGPAQESRLWPQAVEPSPGSRTDTRDVGEHERDCDRDIDR